MPVALKDSILQSTKKILGIDAPMTAFDLDIMTHINAAFAQLSDLGLGPDDGFLIEDEDTVWEDFSEGFEVSRVKTYVYLFVRRIFDPASTGYLSTAMDNQIKEAEVRLSYNRENLIPIPEVVIVDE